MTYVFFNKTTYFIIFNLDDDKTYTAFIVFL